MEREIGATDLRQNLTDVLQEIREERVTYVIETFGRPQAALVSLDEYRRFKQYQQERKDFFQWLEETSTANSALNKDLTEAELLELINKARSEVEDQA